MKLLNILTIIIILIIIIFSYLFFHYFNSDNDYINKISNFKTFVYSIAWEDFKIDSKYLNISETDNILMITTGGCNILNTLLLNPNNIISCDLSPSQNALLDLKISAIKNLNYNDFWQLFGLGKHNNIDYLYNNKLKKSLKLYSSMDFWDKNLNILYTKGLYKSGKICEPINFLRILYKKKLEKLCNFSDKNEQYNYYLKNIEPILFNKKTKKFVKKIVLEFAGVPKSQIKIIGNDKYSEDILYEFIKNSYDFVLKNWSIKNENYFFHALLMGYYTKNNCPEYLKEKNFEFLKKNINKIKLFNGTLNDYINNNNTKFDRFILLDHMDWYEEKKQIDTIFNLMYKNSNKNAFGLFRSGNSKSWITEYIKKNKNINLIDLCHESINDRLGTYPGFFKFEILKNNS
jgi:S-adenosylmethionine:diacylglycerol 3-amino-3-carboxypropyl transferase